MKRLTIGLKPFLRHGCWLAPLLVAAGTWQALAASSEWSETVGGGVRLVTSGAPDAQGRLKGALQVRLDPGWKTYWRDPGAAGVPPMLDIGTAGSVEMEYPAPEWHNDGEFDWAGYKSSVSFPVTLTLNRSGPIEATAFLGLCETICIPLQAKLSLDPAANADDIRDMAEVNKAAAALPAPASDGFGATLGSITEKQITVDAKLPVNEAAELFLAGDQGYQFGKPKPQQEGGKTSFTVKVVSKPQTKPQGPGLAYTLKTANGAVSGTLPYF